MFKDFFLPSISEMKTYLLETRYEKKILFFFIKTYKENERKTRYFKNDFEFHTSTHFRPHKDKIKEKE